jgi:hypothetical protein
MNKSFADNEITFDELQRIVDELKEMTPYPDGVMAHVVTSPRMDFVSAALPDYITPLGTPIYYTDYLPARESVYVWGHLYVGTEREKHFDKIERKPPTYQLSKTAVFAILLLSFLILILSTGVS